MYLCKILLVIIGIFAVYSAVNAALNLIDDSMDNSVKEELVSHCNEIAVYAQQFYFKPAAMGGGDHTFNTCGSNGKGFRINPNMSLSKNGTYSGWANEHVFYITAVPIMVKGKYYNFSQVLCSVTPSSVTVVVQQ